jgi:hypothetical protein
MKQVSKEEFFNFFKNRTDISTHAETPRIWVVTKRGSSLVIAKSIEDNNGEEEFFIQE